MENGLLTKIISVETWIRNERTWHRPYYVTHGIAQWGVSPGIIRWSPVLQFRYMSFQLFILVYPIRCNSGSTGVDLKDSSCDEEYAANVSVY